MKIEIEDLARFSANLRKKGVPASIRSTETALLATQIFKNNHLKTSYSNIKEALGAIYIKNKDHKKEFEQAFQDTFGVPENELNKITLKNLSKNNKKPGQNEAHSSNYKMEQSSLNLKKNPKMKLNKLKENNIDFKPPLKDYNSMDLRENSLMERDSNNLDFFEPELFELCQKIGRKIAN